MSENYQSHPLSDDFLSDFYKTFSDIGENEQYLTDCLRNLCDIFRNPNFYLTNSFNEYNILARILNLCTSENNDKTQKIACQCIYHLCFKNIFDNNQLYKVLYVFDQILNNINHSCFSITVKSLCCLVQNEGVAKLIPIHIHFQTLCNLFINNIDNWNIIIFGIIKRPINEAFVIKIIENIIDSNLHPGSICKMLYFLLLNNHIVLKYFKNDISIFFVEKINQCLNLGDHESVVFGTNLINLLIKKFDGEITNKNIKSYSDLNERPDHYFIVPITDIYKTHHQNMDLIVSISEYIQLILSLDNHISNSIVMKEIIFTEFIPISMRFFEDDNVPIKVKVSIIPVITELILSIDSSSKDKLSVITVEILENVVSLIGDDEKMIINFIDASIYIISEMNDLYHKYYKNFYQSECFIDFLDSLSQSDCAKLRDASERYNDYVEVLNIL